MCVTLVLLEVWSLLHYLELLGAANQGGIKAGRPFLGPAGLLLYLFRNKISSGSTISLGKEH